MTDHASLNELILASDVLVSDYSSVFFDYAITGKPMLHFTYDYDTYAERRGMYFDVRDYLDGGATEDEVIALLVHLDVGTASVRTKAFRDRYVNFFENASSAAVDCIWDTTCGD